MRQALARNAHYYEKARAFGKLVAQYSAGKDPEDMLFICTGGGPGIMQAANRGAYEGDGVSVGLSIALPMEESANPYVTPALSFKFHYFALRKMHFMMRAKALVAFPGGFGTLDELFEVITLVQTRKSKQVPIVLFGSDYWKRLVNFDVLIEEGVISAADLDLFQYADEPEAAWEIIKGVLPALRPNARRVPAPTARPTTQNTPEMPTTAPATPNSMGMATLDALIAMMRSAIASPWRASGVIWCKVLMIIGCTVPSATPSSTEHRPMASAECRNG